jgi:hypothetical protein
MKSSNLALRLDEFTAPVPQYEPRPQSVERVSYPVIVNSRTARPRSSLGFRAIAIRDQGLRPFRVF